MKSYLKKKKKEDLDEQRKDSLKLEGKCPGWMEGRARPTETAGSLESGMVKAE